MEATVRGEARKAAPSAKAPGFDSADEAREVLDALLQRVDGSEGAGGPLCARLSQELLVMSALGIGNEVASCCSPLLRRR